MSNIIGGASGGSKVRNEKKDCESQMELTVSEKDGGSCSCKRQNVKVTEGENIGKKVTELLKAHKGGKAVIRLEIKFQ